MDIIDKLKKIQKKYRLTDKDMAYALDYKYREGWAMYKGRIRKPNINLEDRALKAFPELNADSPERSCNTHRGWLRKLLRAIIGLK